MRPARLLLLTVLLLAACAPRLQTVGAPTARPEIEGDKIRMADGYRLPLQLWPAKASPKAVVVALHGFNDYRNAWSGPGPWWADQGVTVYAYDQRGFGDSAQRGIWPGVGVLAGDLTGVAELVRAAHPGVPLYLVGHSMGAAVIMTAMGGADPPEVDGIVLAAPAVWGRKTMNPFLRFTLWLAVHTQRRSDAPDTGCGTNPGK